MKRLGKLSLIIIYLTLILPLFINISSIIYCQNIYETIVESPDYNLTIKDGLLSNKVYGLVQDYEGFIYFYTDLGISKYDGHKFKNFTINEGLPTNDVWLLSLDSKNRIWIHTNEDQLTFLKNDSIFFLDSPNSMSSTFHIEMDSNDTILFQGRNNFKLHYNKNRYTYYNWNADIGYYATNHFIDNFYYNFEQCPYAYFANCHKLKILNDKKKQIYEMVLDKNTFFYSPLKMKESVHCSSTNGLMIFNKGKLNSIYKVVSDKILNRSIVDCSNNLWVCYKNDGVGFYLPNQKIFKFKNFIPLYSFNYNNLLFLVNENGQCNLFDLDKNLFVNLFTLSGTRLINEWFNSKFLVYSDKGINILNLNKRKSKIDSFSYHSKLNEYPAIGKSVFKLSQDSFITPNYLLQCLLYLEYKNTIDTFTFHKSTSAIKSINISPNNINLYSKGKLAIYSKNLLFQSEKKLIFKNKEIVPITSILYPFTNENIFASEDLGLFRLDCNNEVIQINGTEKLSVKNLTLLGNKLVLWSNNGIFILTYKNDNYIIVNTITNEQGIAPEEIVGVYPWKNELIIVMPNAIHHINPDSIKVKTYNLRITELIQNNKKISIEDLSQLPPGFKSISISMSLLDFQVSKDVAYQYNLNDNDWQTLAVNTLDLSDLASGSYKLNLRAINKYSNKLLDSKVLKLNVLRPWWKTWQFIFLINGLLISSIILGYRKWLNRRNEIKINIRNLEIGLREYKMKALESQMNPHFVYNSLASIQYFIQENKNKEAEHFLTEFGILIRSFLTASRSSQINLKIELELLQKFINLEQIRFSQRFTSEIIIDPKLNLTKIFIPPLLLQPFVENAIQHGLFHRLEGGQLKLTFQTSNRDLVVTISDNGIGTEKSKSLKKFSLSNTTSDAMEIFLEKLEIMNKLKPNSLEYLISNLDDNEPNYVGTKIEIIFKNIIVS